MNFVGSQINQTEKDRFLIREIRPSDNEAIKSIILQVSKEYKIYDSKIGYTELDDLYQIFHADRSNYWIVEDLNTAEILGGGGYQQLDNSSSVAELQKLFLLPEARGHGLAKKIVELILNHSKGAGYKQVYLETASQMKEAIVLYENFGFKRVEKSMGKVEHVQCTLFMIKDL